MPEALIWGASGGIGGALVKLLKGNGWRVFAAARDERRIPKEADVMCEFEAANEYSFQETAYRVGQESSGLDLVVYAAGGLTAATLEAMDGSAWRATLDANLNGAARAAQASVNLLKEGGHMMFIGAYVEKLMLPKFSAYAAAKAGLEPLVTILSKEHRKLKFSLARPGAVDTPFWQNVPFGLPKNALSSAAVAEAMFTHWESGKAGTLDL